jgi:hypothetical protein
MNQTTTGRKGKQQVQFTSDGAVVEWTTPFLEIGGVIYGARTQEFRGDLEFFDRQNGLRAHVKMNCESVKGGWFGGGKKGATDLLNGFVFASADSESANHSTACSSEFSSQTCDERHCVEVASFHGSWVEHFTVDSSPAIRKAGKGKPIRMWDLSKHCGYECVLLFVLDNVMIHAWFLMR